MLYLYLFHGRENPDQNLDDWGEEGPTFGPLQYVHTTYRDDIKVLAAGAADSVVLSTVGDCLYYDGMYYGDWSVYEADSPTRDLVQIDEAKAKPPKVESTAKVCRECGGPGFVLIPPSLKRKDAEIRRCLTCE